MKTCTVALTRKELLVLSIVTHDSLRVDVHMIVTAGIPALDKTRLIVDATQQWHELMNQLDWTGVRDGERAYRQISEHRLAALVVNLRDFDVSTVSEAARANFAEAREPLLASLVRALQAPALPSDVTQAPAKA